MSASKKIIQAIARHIQGPVDTMASISSNDFPFGKSILASKSAYKKTWDYAKDEIYPEVDNYEKKSGFSISRKWFEELALLTQVVVKDSRICYQHGRVLYSALSAYISQKELRGSLRILETGTARGFSSLCMAKALKDSDMEGTIHTLDLLPNNKPMYWNCIADHEGPQTRKQLLDRYSSLIEKYIVFIQGDTLLQLGKIDIPRIHFAFVDGNHSYKYVYSESKHIQDRQESDDIIVFDDYTHSKFPDVVRAVDEFCHTYGYSMETLQATSSRTYVIARKLSHPLSTERIP